MSSPIASRARTRVALRTCRTAAGLGYRAFFSFAPNPDPSPSRKNNWLRVGQPTHRDHGVCWPVFFDGNSCRPPTLQTGVGKRRNAMTRVQEPRSWEQPAAIDLRDREAVGYWTEKLQVTPRELEEVVERVSLSAHAEERGLEA